MAYLKLTISILLGL